MKKMLIFSLIVLFLPLLAITDAQTAIEMLQQATQKDFPAADEVSVENQIIDLNEKCLGTKHYESFRKVLTHKAKQNNRVRFAYDSDYSELRVEIIEIIKSNGEVVELNPQQILQKNLNPYSKQMNIYSGSSWILTGELPNLEIGDIIHTKQTRTILKTRMENNFFDQISVDNYSPKLLQTYQLKMPSNLELYIHHVNKKENYVQFNQNKDGNFTVYEWQVKNPPQIIYEPGMENLDRFGYNIVLTTIKKWEEVSRWYYGLVEPHLKPNDAIREKVEELTDDTNSKLEKIKNIFYWVAQKIRYLGVDKEEHRPGYEPHDVDYTFETRGGVCRDKSALLVSMFRLAGIEADPILISVGYQLYDKAPLVWFNHAIVVSYDAEGKPEYFFDPTDENTKDFLPQYEEDCSYIIASKKGDVLRTVPVSSSERNKTKVELAVEVGENSQTNCNLSISYSGMADNIMRSSLMQMTPKRKQDRIEKMVSQIHPQAKLENYSVSEPQNRNININLSCSFSIPKYIEISEDYTFIPLEAGKFSISFLHEYILQVFNLNNRKYPFKLPMTYSIEFTEKLTLPEDITAMSFPELPSIDFQKINLLSTRNIKSNYVEYTCKFAIDKIHFKKEDYLPLKREISKLNSLNKLFLIGEK